ncbi:error-prone DNA polymerase [Acidithrix sp. C25]|uniref:error-prone DNA polymerase n=1 Tax=Acidithrix sp. C25 TaxID=1671482 RepID=UPI0020BF9CB0|nr:error-prone DNA polymerase [Acidithrix sp. C25]
MNDNPKYAELHCHSNFSFLDGVSSPSEIVERAIDAELPICAITDHNGLYGVVAFAGAARGTSLKTVFGAELTINSTKPRDNIEDPQGEHLVILAKNPSGYASLSRVISKGHLKDSNKGVFDLSLDDLSRCDYTDWVILSGCRKGGLSSALIENGPQAARRVAKELSEIFGRDRFVIECWDHGDPLDQARNDEFVKIATDLDLNCVASNNVHYASTKNAKLHSVTAAIRAGKNLDGIDGWLPVDQMAHLRSPRDQLRRFRRYPELVSRAYEIGLECAFDLSLLAPALPNSLVPHGQSQTYYLRSLTMKGATERYGPKDNERVKGAYAQLEYELKIIERLGFGGYFLIVWDIVQFARSSNIYCQGRGSAANSAVCYALGITNVDPVSLGLLFERFLSTERDGPPDIDVDFESEAREEVIQYVYEKYGRDRAAQVSNVITYRSRSAIRDVARAFGYPTSVINTWSKQVDRYKSLAEMVAVRDAKGEPILDLPPRVAQFATEIERSPRHLGIHTGGMVICDRPIVEVCPVEWARRPGRTVLQWDKDDCAIAGLVKFDLLGLGMLEALHRMVDTVFGYYGQRCDLALIPQEDVVYEMLSQADTVGVFQVESRAQMATLPRLRPRHFYDLVVEVALIRPGPIQGGSVHPYIRRRNGLEKVTYLHPLLEKSLSKTLGVPLFQEQLMQMAIDVAGFTPSEADQLRQAMGSKRSKDRMEKLKVRFYEGMARNGIVERTADEIFAKLEAFANFGFPESHSASFAYLVYASAWFKYFYTAAFTASIINSQPMGFWSRETLIEDAKRHGVEVLGPHVNFSSVECTLEGPSVVRDPSFVASGNERPKSEGGYISDIHERCRIGPNLRIGIGQIAKVGKAMASSIVANAPYLNIEDLVIKTSIDRAQLESLASSGALEGLTSSGAGATLTRRQAIWIAEPLARRASNGLPGMTLGDEAPKLKEMTSKDRSYMDLAAFGMTPTSHPMAFFRDRLSGFGVSLASELVARRNRDRIKVAGVVTHRQRPATANGVTFISLEDETGLMNVVVARDIWDSHRQIVRLSNALIIEGVLESYSGVVNIVAKHIEPLDISIGSMSRDFH